MPAPRAVVSGGSIAGFATAFWLARAGWEVTVLERAAAFRDGGQNVDVRGTAREVLDRMGLTQAVKDLNTTETGTVFVDERGQVIAELPANGPDGATAELEVLRGDLARVVHDALPPTVQVRYDATIAAVDDQPAGVRLTLASGDLLDADLLVVAEGVRSSTRDLVLGDEADLRPLDIDMVFGTIARTAGDDDRWRWHNTVGGRQIHLRPDNRGTTRAILAHSPSEDLASLDLDDALIRLRDRFADAGWEAPRVLDGFADSDDVYVDSLAQVRMERWHTGRVCLVGDAAWCVTPVGGGGSSLALVGAYVLAASVTGSAAGPADLATGLAAYEDWMRPLVARAQRLPPGMDKIAFPQTVWGLKLRNLAAKVATSAPFEPLLGLAPELVGSDRPLPEMSGSTTGR